MSKKQPKTNLARRMKKNKKRQMKSKFKKNISDNFVTELKKVASFIHVTLNEAKGLDLNVKVQAEKHGLSDVYEKYASEYQPYFDELGKLEDQVKDLMAKSTQLPGVELLGQLNDIVLEVAKCASGIERTMNDTIKEVSPAIELSNAVAEVVNKGA